MVQNSFDLSAIIFSAIYQNPIPPPCGIIGGTGFSSLTSATRLSVVAIIVNLLCCAIFYVVSKIPSNIPPEAFLTKDGIEYVSTEYVMLLGFDKIFGGTWFILLDRTIAFLISGITNNYLNDFIGTFFKKSPDSKKAFVTRTYISTFIGQFFDNMIFAVLTYMLFAPIFWDGLSWTFLQCVTCSLTGAVAELLMEVLFSPLGYKISCNWIKDCVGKEYFKHMNVYEQQ